VNGLAIITMNFILLMMLVMIKPLWKILTVKINAKLATIIVTPLTNVLLTVSIVVVQKVNGIADYSKPVCQEALPIANGPLMKMTLKILKMLKMTLKANAKQDIFSAKLLMNV